ncbi:hypothetical protein K2173_026482 [Erythroxylum novogranatense]|uniref:Protein SMG9-like n=1 Tax=Erythroxylum novogranatense TaxID=1862640 RepID=A0AAV8TYP3_9ROSI|nr:hypothetical protein K2173_026482 [Erythroxylum novogranatense]
MAGATGGTTSSSLSPAPPPPKILLAKPGLITGGPVPSKFGRSSGEGDATQHHSRLPPISSLNLLSDSWEFHIDRFLPFLTENTDFKVVGVIGPQGVGKSTILNELYGYDGSSPGMLPPFTTQSEDSRAMGRHCTVGIEPRISAERLILLDTQAVFSSSVLAEMTRSDSTSTISVLSGENLSAELANELMAIQLGVLLASICNVLLVVSDEVQDDNMWRLLSTVDLLKHGIPDPSLLTTSHFQSSTIGFEKENKDQNFNGEEYIATMVFVHTKKLLEGYFGSSSFIRAKPWNIAKDLSLSSVTTVEDDVTDLTSRNLFLIPYNNNDNSPRSQYESYISALWKLRDQVLSLNCSSFARNVSERDWLKNSAKIWELVKSSSIIADYGRSLQSSGMFRR